MVGTAYQVLTYHSASPAYSRFTTARRAKRKRQLAGLAAELLAIRAQFSGIENFLQNATGSTLREFQFSYGSGAIVFRDAPQMATYVSQVNALVKHYTTILRKTFSIIEEFEGEGLRLPPDFVHQIGAAKDALNAAQFRSQTIGEAIDNAMKALDTINDALNRAET